MDNLTDIELADLLGAPENDASVQQRAATLAAALRKQQADAQGQQFMAGLAGNFANPGATSMGKAFGDMGAQQYEQAGKQLEGIPKVTEERLKRALEARKLDIEAQKSRQGKVPASSPEALARFGEESKKLFPILEPNGLEEDQLKSLLGAAGGRMNAKATVTAADTAATREQQRYEREQAALKKETARKSTVPSRPFLDPANPPTTEVASQVMAKDTAAQNLDNALVNLEKMVVELSPYEKLSGDPSDAFKSAIQSVNTQYQVLAGLGVPSGKDAEMTMNAMGNPGGFWQIMRGRGGAGIKEMRANAVRSADINAAEHGFGPRKGAAPKQAQDPKAAEAWARANPSDPRSAAILKKLGLAP